MIELALRAEAGRTPAEHFRAPGPAVGRLRRGGRGDTEAWDRSAPSADEIAGPGPGNRMLAAPYTKLLCSQWNVDKMSGAMVFMSARAAEAAGITTDRWVHPLLPSRT